VAADASGRPRAAVAVYCILADGDELWMSTSEGLSRMNRTTGDVRTFGAGDDLHGNRFDTAACYRSPSGELFFGGTFGFHSFDPKDIHDNPHVPPVALTAVYVLNRKLQQRQLPPAVERLRLSYRQNLLTFEFAALDFDNPERNLYSYRLEGFDRDWVDAGHRRSAVYANLPPGEYTFHVRGSNNDGVWNEAGVTLPLTIRPPLLRSGWAYTAYALSLVGLVALLLRAHGRRIRQRGEDLRKTEELERARSLQLSMLPREPPRLPELDIAVHMETATEVGGDYYDFFPQDDGSLFIAIGDATGHGLSAGMMVSMTKIALRSLDVRAPARILDRLSSILHEIHPSGLRMALGLALIRRQEVEISSAAMPPVLVYDRRSRRVEEVLLPALPLGGRLPQPYPERTIPLAPGDTLVLISDGLPERRNPFDECLGYRQVEECLAEHGERSAQEILDALVDLGEHWAGGRPPEDDVTVLVVQRRPEDA
ncbi:MAG: SpoIIE family protein phosphatase, partial [Acidobacteria bacterium]|nr:SpoIIE family protein phosphatase [Acidobacteriota bacterium]